MRHCLFLLALPLAAQEESYPRDSASPKRDDVPAGTLTKHAFSASKVFPGTHRDYWVYVPAQYKADTPACLIVFQDGRSHVGKPGTTGYVPTIFDNLIHAGDMPVTIGLFINPGVVPAPRENAQPRFNRSYEYDGMGPNYALDGQCSAASGHLLVGTEAGLQIFDQPGRVQLILPRPDHSDGRINYCALHGDTLHISTRHRIYKRRVKLTAAPAWQAPVAPPKPRL